MKRAQVRALFADRLVTQPRGCRTRLSTSRAAQLGRTCTLRLRRPQDHLLGRSHAAAVAKTRFSSFAAARLHARRCNIGGGKNRRGSRAPLPQPCPSRPDCNPLVRDSRYLPCEEKCVHVSEIFLPRGAFWQSREIARWERLGALPTATTNDSAGAPRRANGKCACAHLTHPTPTAFAFAFSVTEPLLPSPRRGGPPPAICRRFKSAIYVLSS